MKLVGAALRQLLAVVLASVSVVADACPAVLAVGGVDPDLDDVVVAVEALDASRDRAAGGRSARRGGDSHSEEHEKGGGEHCHLSLC